MHFERRTQQDFLVDELWRETDKSQILQDGLTKWRNGSAIYCSGDHWGREGMSVRRDSQEFSVGHTH